MSKVIKLGEKELEILREYQSKQNNITFELGNQFYLPIQLFALTNIQILI